MRNVGCGDKTRSKTVTSSTLSTGMTGLPFNGIGFGLVADAGNTNSRRAGVEGNLG